jgi:hypothetical protein
MEFVVKRDGRVEFDNDYWCSTLSQCGVGAHIIDGLRAGKYVVPEIIDELDKECLKLDHVVAGIAEYDVGEILDKITAMEAYLSEMSKRD